MTVDGRRLGAASRSQRQQRLIDRIGSSVQKYLEPAELPLVIGVALEDFTFPAWFGPWTGLFEALRSVPHRRVVLLTTDRLLLMSAPVFRLERAVIRATLDRRDVRVVEFEPGMEITPTLTLEVRERRSTLYFAGPWGPEGVEIHRLLATQTNDNPSSGKPAADLRDG